MSTACESAAAYVLGALPAAERSEFEEHLATCEACRRTVGDLAGIPGLLSRVSASDLEDSVPVPDTLVPGLLRQVRRSGRRRRVLLSALSAAALVLAVVGTAVVVDRSNRPGSTSTPQMTAMSAVVDSPVTARVALVGHSWGTEIRMDCRYADSGEWSRPYDLVAVADTGRTYRVATWVVGPGKTASVTGSVPVTPDHLDRVEIRLTSGTPLLRLTP